MHIECRGQVNDTLECLPALRNYFGVVVSHCAGQRATVVVNCHIAVVAICVEGQLPLEPLPLPKLSAAFAQTCPELAILEPADLLRPISSADLSELGSAELDQIKYWKPATIGELVFNWWD